jgi:hypothetical protein
MSATAVLGMSQHQDSPLQGGFDAPEFLRCQEWSRRNHRMSLREATA